MSYQSSIATIQGFLSSKQYSGGFNFDQFLGIIVSTLSCSEYISDAEIAELVFGNVEEEFNQWFENEQLRKAWVVLFNDFTEQLVLENFDLQKNYPLAADAIAPTQALSDWCDGYLHGYHLTEEIWFDDFDFLSSDPDFKESQGIIEDCESSLDLIATFARWDYALEESESIEQLEALVPEIYQALSEGVLIRHKLAILLESEKLEYADFDNDELTDAEELEFLQQVETFVRVTPKIGRNDPCFCGSGKKYKKCCLN